MASSVIKKTILALIVTSFFYAMLLFISDINEIVAIINQINLGYYLLVFPLTFLTIVILGWRYQIILKKLNINLGFKDSFLLHAVGLSMSMTPGGAGSVLKSYFLKMKTGNSISSTTPIVIYEKWLELVAVIILIGILLSYYNIIESQIIFVIGSLLSGFVFFVFKKTIGLELLNKFFSKIRFLRNFVINTNEFKDTTKILTKTKNVLELLGLTLLSKLVPMITVFIIFDQFDLRFNIFSSSQIYFTSLIAGVLSFVPGGIVVTEASLLGLLLKNHAALGIAVVIVLLVRMPTFWFPIFIGFLSLRAVSKGEIKTD